MDHSRTSLEQIAAQAVDVAARRVQVGVRRSIALAVAAVACAAAVAPWWSAGTGLLLGLTSLPMLRVGHGAKMRSWLHTVCSWQYATADVRTAGELWRKRSEARVGVNGAILRGTARGELWPMPPPRQTTILLGWIGPNKAVALTTSGNWACRLDSLVSI